jgi:hypothetical protein
MSDRIVSLLGCDHRIPMVMEQSFTIQNQKGELELTGERGGAAAIEGIGKRRLNGLSGALYNATTDDVKHPEIDFGGRFD